MREAQGRRVQQQPIGSRLHARRRVQRVTEDRMAERLQVHAQLVRAAGDRLELEPGAIAGLEGEIDVVTGTR